MADKTTPVTDFTLYQFPKAAVFNKILPKTKIYEHTKPSTRIKDLFVQDVEKIIWSYKLAPDTVNLPAKGSLQEIQVFTLLLKKDIKTGSIHPDILMTIDKAIPSPIMFVLKHGDKLKYAMAYKRKSLADKSKQVISQHFITDCQPLEAEHHPLPVVLNLQALQHQMLINVIPLAPKNINGQAESTEALVERAELLQQLQREADKIQAQIGREKQYNRKVELNGQLKAIKKQIQEQQ